MMMEIEVVDLNSPKKLAQFIQFPFRLYKDCEQWVPPFIGDMRVMLDRKKHPFHEHSDVEFFIAKKNGEIVGRVAAIENKPYNQYHQTRQASFYFFECVDDQEVANKLFERVFDWMASRGLNKLVGPKGLGPLDGYGILVKGFEHRPMMTMMNYNYPYYPVLLERLGFVKEVDFVSAYVHRSKFRMPEKVHQIAARVLERGTFQVIDFKNKRDLRAWADKIGQAYNRAFVNNWEYYPLSDREIKFVTDSILAVADPHLIKIILKNNEVVGFLFAFPDISAALQRQKGKITPWGILDFLLEMRRTKWVAMNGGGVLPEYHGRGGNALLYSIMEKTAQNYHFEHIDMTQVAETAVQMRKDLETLGGEFYKNHRVYAKEI